MNKEEFIGRYGEEAYAKKQAQSDAWNKTHPKERAVAQKAYSESHPEEVVAATREQTNKGGKYYDKKLVYDHTGLPGEKSVVRVNHARQWRPYKRIIAPWSQIHHEWIPGTADYRGVALVEKDQHIHGFIDVIEIMEGKITLLTEAEVKEKRGERK